MSNPAALLKFDPQCVKWLHLETFTTVELPCPYQPAPTSAHSPQDIFQMETIPSLIDPLQWNYVISLSKVGCHYLDVTSVSATDLFRQQASLVGIMFGE